MRALDLKSYLEQIENKVRIPIIVRALSHDQNIWSFFEILNESQFPSIQNLIVENRLNPGTLSLTILEPELVQSGYPQSRLHSDFLEDCMAEYESFVQNRTERVSKERLVKLAIVLIEKRKISSSWADVILEIINRMKIENSKEMLALWGTPLVIAINLINDREELLSDLFKLQSIEMGIDLLLHNLQCMPIDDEESAQLVFSATNSLPVEFQEKIVQKLVLISEKELAKKSALLFIEKYRDIDINEQNSVKFWNQPSDSLQKALAFKHIAGIAQIANEFEISEKFFRKSLYLSHDSI